MKLSDAEWTVMDALWERSPASVRDVLERVAPEREWAYTTVKTILTRLTEKGALQRSKRANVSLFTPLVTREQARQSALRWLLDKAFDGTFGSLVQHMMTEERLSARDRKRLEAMIRELDQKSGKASS